MSSDEIMDSESQESDSGSDYKDHHQDEDVSDTSKKNPRKPDNLVSKNADENKSDSENISDDGPGPYNGPNEAGKHLA